jgi:hypothetical protein
VYDGNVVLLKLGFGDLHYRWEPHWQIFNRVKIIIFTSPNDARVTRGEAVIAGHLPPVGSRLDLAEIELF